MIHADGSVLGACIHAAVAALLDAGIEMKLLPIAVTCAVCNGDCSGMSGADFVLDPVSEEEDRSIVVILDSRKKFLSCHSSSSLRISKESLVSSQQLAENVVPAIRAFFQMVMEQRTERESKTIWSLSPA